MGLFDRVFKRQPTETAADRQQWLDAQINIIGQRAVTAYAATMRQASRNFEAAETPAWVESWPTHGSPINDDLSRQLPTLLARARGLARNNEWAINYLTKLDDNVLGSNGLTLQMRVKKRNGKLDEKTNALLESAWATWGQFADVSGLSWRQVESLALKAGPQDGALLYQFRLGAGPFRFQIQLLPIDLLDVNLRRDYGGNRVRMGVEINNDGLPVAYWILAARAGDLPSDYVTVGKHLRVPADKMQHHFLRHEIGQVRGYPWLAGGARRLWLLRDFEESAAVACSNAAKRQGFFYTADGEAPTGFADKIVSGVLESAKAAGKQLTPEEVQALVSASEKYVTTLPGQFDTLPSNTRFEKFESSWPNVNAEGYVKQQVRGWSAAQGMSYISVGNDLEAVNYSSAQVGIGDEREHYKTVQGLHRDWLSAPVFNAVLPYLILATPGLDMNKIEIYRAAATWQPRRWRPVDPVKEAAAHEANLRNKLTSRRRIILERGDDPDEIAAEVEEEEKRYGPMQATGITQAAATPDDDEGEDGNDPKKGTDDE